MAKALKCDRCGKFYDEHLNDYEIAGQQVVGMRMITDHNAFKTYDLCDDCVEDLYEFMKEKKGDN